MPNVPVCSLCEQPVGSIHHQIEQQIVAQIKRSHPSWTEADGSCAKCVEHYKNFDPTSPLG